MSIKIHDELISIYGPATLEVNYSIRGQYRVPKCAYPLKFLPRRHVLLSRVRRNLRFRRRLGEYRGMRERFFIHMASARTALNGVDIELTLRDIVYTVFPRRFAHRVAVSSYNDRIVLQKEFFQSFRSNRKGSKLGCRYGAENLASLQCSTIAKVFFLANCIIYHRFFWRKIQDRHPDFQPTSLHFTGHILATIRQTSLTIS